MSGLLTKEEARVIARVNAAAIPRTIIEDATGAKSLTQWHIVQSLHCAKRGKASLAARHLDAAAKCLERAVGALRAVQA
jgi:hypothetical protein